MKTTIRKILFTTGILSILCSCTHDFDEINKNPNASEEANGMYFLTGVIVRTAYDYQDKAYMGKPAAAGRYITMLRNAGSDSFNWGPESWSGHYNRLFDTKALYEWAEQNGEDQFMALAMIMEVFNYAYVTELWGDLPYSEALRSKSDGIIYPKYDKQEEVYPDLIRKLKEANDMLSKTSRAINASVDVLYEGDNLKWRKFANSLRLRMLMRVSEKLPNTFTEMQEIVNNPSQYPIFTSNNDNAELPYNETTHKFPGGPTEAGSLEDEYKEFIKRRPSKEIIDFYIERQDPRLPVLFDSIANPENGTVDKNKFVGAPIALKSVYEYNGGGDNISTLRKEIFYKDYHKLVKATLINYSEVCFILAEALQRGEITMPGETAQSMYEKGIRANMEYWEIDESAIEANLAHEKVAYDGTLKQIIGQKWASLFIIGCEGWFDYRRTNDILGLNDGLIQDALAQDFIPYRYIYPDGERSQNREQYNKAIQTFGEDSQNTKMWLIK